MATITVDALLKVCAAITAVCVAGSWLIKTAKAAKKPADDIHQNIKGNKSKIDHQEERLNNIDETLDYLVNANNLVIRVLFTVLGELSNNNDKDGHIAKAQSDIQNFLTPVKRGEPHE